MLDAISIVFWGLLMLMAIVFIHELGHFLAARAFGVRVKEFMLGLPGPSIGFTRKGTRFGVTCIPLGGYARIAGMESGPENPHLSEAAAYLAYFGTLSLDEVQRSSEVLGFDLEEALDVLFEWGTVLRKKDKSGAYTYMMQATSAASEACATGEPRPMPDPQAFIDAERRMTFRALSWWKRIVVLAAGAVFNLVFAVIVFTIVLMFLGKNVPSTTIESVNEGSPAAVAGIAPGDRIIGVDGVAMDDWQSVTAAISAHAPGDTAVVSYEHDGAAAEAELTLADSDGRAIIGVVSHIEQQAIPLHEAAGAAVGFIGYVAVAIVNLLNPATFQDTIAQSSSVVGVSVEAQRAATQGFLPFIVLCAGLSISIGLMNLLPVPPLDGGKMIVETIQRIIRRDIPARVVNGISVVGIVLMLALFFVCTSQDIQRYFIGG